LTQLSVDSGGRRSRALTSWSGLLLLGMLGLGLMHLRPSTKSTGGPEEAAQSRCLAWDREASEGIAALIFDNHAATELRLKRPFFNFAVLGRTAGRALLVLQDTITDPCIKPSPCGPVPFGRLRTTMQLMRKCCRREIEVKVIIQRSAW
jgi:hypothetical protein